MVTRPPLLVALLSLGACTQDALVVAPVIDIPAGDADPFPDLDTIEISIALAGAPEALRSRTVARGDLLELPEVPYGENLVVHLLGRARGAEVAVGRTCAFPIRPAEPPATPHLYFARTVKWANVGMPSQPVRLGGAALATAAGAGVFIGGVAAAGAPIGSVDVFDPASGEHALLAEVTPREDGAVAALGDGRLVIVGGVDRDGAPTRALDVVDVGAVAGRRVETIDAGPLVTRMAPALATLRDGRIVAVGGTSPSGDALGALVEISGESGGVTLRELRARLAQPRSAHTATRLSDELGAPVLIAGGLAAGVPIATAELYKPLVDGIAPIKSPMQVPRYDARAVRLPDGSVLFVGGFDAANAPVAALEVFSLESGFQLVGNLPASAGLVDQTLTVLPDGRVLLAGGRDANGMALDTAFIIRLDPLGGGIDVATTDRLHVPRAAHQATRLCDGTILLVGGTPEPSPAERYNPPAAGRR